MRLKLIVSCMLLFVVFLSGCATQQFVLSDRVTAYALGEIELKYYEPVFDQLNPLEIDLFGMTVKQQIKTKLSSQLTGDQPLHVYVNVTRVVMPKKGTQVLSNVFGASTEDRADIVIIIAQGKKDVAAPLLHSKEVTKKQIEYFEANTLKYAELSVYVAGGLFSERGAHIAKLAEAVAGTVAKAVTHDFKATGVTYDFKK